MVPQDNDHQLAQFSLFQPNKDHTQDPETKQGPQNTERVPYHNYRKHTRQIMRKDRRQESDKPASTGK